MPDNPRHHDDVTGADDLTRIGGIGSKIADRLYAAGILTYADLASRSADELSKLLTDVSGLSAGRLDSWRDQARELAAEEAQAAPASPAAEVAPGAASGGQHYESFLVRVLLNEDGSVRRTTAQHIRTGAERHWPGLERQALPEFIETAIASAVPSAEPPSDRVQEADTVEGPPAELVSAEATPAGPATAREGLAGPSPARPMSSAVLSVEPAILRAAEPFTMTLTVGLSGPASQADRLAYSAVIAAKPLDGGSKRTIAESDGLLVPASPTITIGAAGLSAGAYRLDGAVSLREPGQDHPVQLAALAEGLLVQVSPS